MNLKKVFALSIVLGLFSIGSAHAAMVVVNASGTISGTSGADIFGVSSGDSWSMSYSYDTDTVPFLDTGAAAFYSNNASMSFTLGGVTYTAPASDTASIIRNTGFGDSYTAGAGTDTPFSANGLSGLAGFFNLTDSSGSVFSDTGLPESLLLSDFNINSFIFGGVGPGGMGAVRGTLDSISFTTGGVSPVPLPAAFWLFGSALAGLFGFKLRRRQTASLPA